VRDQSKAKRSGGGRRLSAGVAVSFTALLTAGVVGTGFVASAASAATPQAAPRASSGGLAYTTLSNPQRIADTRCGASPQPSFCASESLPSANASLATVSPGGTINVAMPSSVPAAASAAVFNVTAVDQTGAGFLTVYGTGGSLPVVSNLNFNGAQAAFGTSNLVTVPLGTSSISVFDGPTTGGSPVDVVVDLEGYYAPPAGSSLAGEYFPLTPARILDTRGSGGTPLGPNSVGNLTVAGAGGVPSTGVSAVLLNVTVTDTTGSSFLTAWPAGATQPVVSNLNWTTGETLANKVLIPLGSGGSNAGAISLYNLAGNTDVVVDVMGYFTDATATTAGAVFTPVTPARMADTRCGASPAPSFCASESLPSGNSALTSPSGGQSVNVAITGNDGVPSNATAAAVDVIDVSPAGSTSNPPTGGNFLTVFAAGSTLPGTSDVNWVPGDVYNVVANGAYGGIGTGGATSVYQGPTTAGATDVVVDVFGFFAAPSGVTITASPSTLQADGVSTSTITVNVTKGGTAVNADPVLLVLSANPTGSCGTITTPNPANTAASGTVTFTYKSSTTAGICTITATEADSGNTGTTTITQTSNNKVVVAAAPASVPADGHSTSTLTVTVTGPTGTPVSGDTVSFTVAGFPSSVCSTAPANGTTNASGVVTATYVAGSVVGFCTITATESAKSATGTATVDQTTTPAPANSPYVVTVVASPATIQANGSATSTITVTVKDTTAAAVAGDPVNLTTAAAPTGSCGTLSSTTGTTSAGGTVTETYTASKVGGVCTITAQEASTAQSAPGTVTQTGNNTVTVAASPTDVPANGAATSTVTVTVLGPTSAPVAGDTIVFTNTPTPAGACGTTSPAGPYTTNASGQVVITYTASTTSGFCNISAAESGTGQTGATSIDQMSLVTPTSITVSASPSSVPAAGASAASTITVTVSRTGTAVSGDTVNFTVSGSPAAVCTSAQLSATSGTTNASGQVVITYNSSTTGGTCTVTAKESDAALSGNTTITQTNNNTVTVVPSPTSIVANGVSTSAVTVTVLNPASVAVSGDSVTLTTAATPSGACGTLGATSGTTNGSGQLVETYISSTTVGFCTIAATEANTSQMGTGMVTQTMAAPANAPFTVTVAASPTTLQANGTSTSTVTATVMNTVPAAVSGDPVMFTLTPSVAGACGTLSATSGTTNGAGQVVVTYTSNSGVKGTCTVTANEAQDGKNGTAVITETTNNTVAVVASPSTIVLSGILMSTSALTVTVTSVTGAVVPGDMITFTLSGANCGTVGSVSNGGVTNSSGVVTATYTSTLALISGFCTVTATEQATAPGNSQAGMATITQIL